MEGSQPQLQGPGARMEGGGSLKVHPHPHTLDAPPLNGIHHTSAWPQGSAAYSADFEGSSGGPKGSLGGPRVSTGGGGGGVTEGGGLKKGQPKKAAKSGHTLGAKPGVKTPSATASPRAQHGRGAAGGALPGASGSGNGQRREAPKASPGSAALDTASPSAHSPLSEPFAVRAPASGAAATSAGASTLGDVLMLTELAMGEQRCGPHTQLLATLGTPHPGPGAAPEDGAQPFSGDEDAGGAPKEPLSVPQEQIRHLRAGLREGQSRARERANAMGVALSKLDRWLHVISTKRKGRPEGGPLPPDRGDASGAPGDSPEVAPFGAEPGVSPVKGAEGGARGKPSGNRKPRTPGSAQRALSLATDGLSDTPLPSSQHSTATPPAQAEGGNGVFSSSFSLGEEGHERKRPSAPTMKGKRSRPGAPGPLAGAGGSSKGEAADRHHGHNSSNNSANPRAPGGREAEEGLHGKANRPKPARGPRGMFVKASARPDAHTPRAAGGEGGAMGAARERERDSGEDLFEGGVAGVVSADFFDHRLGGSSSPRGGQAPEGGRGAGAGAGPGGGGPRLVTQRSRKVSRLMKVLSDGDELLNGGPAEGEGSFLEGSPSDAQEAGTPRDGQDAAGTPRGGQGRGRPRGRRAGAGAGAGYFGGEDEEYVEEADVDGGDDELEEYEDELEDDLDMEFDREGAGGAHRGHARLSGASGAKEDEEEGGGYAPRQRAGGSKGGSGKLKRQGSDAKRKGGSSQAKRKQGGLPGTGKGGSVGGVPAGVPNGDTDLLFLPSDAAVPAASGVAPGGSAPAKKGKKGKHKGKVGRPTKRPVVPTGPTGEPVCSDEEELGLAVTATAEYYAHASSGPLWQFVEPFYGIPADKNLEPIAQLTECAEASDEAHVVPGFCASLKEQEGNRGHRLRQKRVVAEAGTAPHPDAQARAPAGEGAQALQQPLHSPQNGPAAATANGEGGRQGRHSGGSESSAQDKGTLNGGAGGTGAGRASVPRPPWCIAGQMGRHVTGGARSSISQRLLGLLLTQVDSLSLTPSESQPLTPSESQPNARGATQPDSQPSGKGDPSKGSQQAYTPRLSAPNGLTLDANGTPASSGAPGASEQGQRVGPEWQKEWGALSSDARILVELQHLGLGDCVQAVTAQEHPEDDELCATLRSSASSLASGAARSQELLMRLKAELARQHQPQADERKRERILLDRLVESAYNRRTGCKVSSAPSALIPRTSHTVKAARNTSAQFAKRTLERVHAFESSTDADTAAGGVLAAYPLLREKLMQDKEPEVAPAPGIPQDHTGQLPGADALQPAVSGKDRGGKGHPRGGVSAAATPPAPTPATPGLLIDVDEGEGLMYDGGGTLSHTGGALLLREAVPARTGGVKREPSGGSAQGGGGWQGGGGAGGGGGGGGGSGRWARGPSPSEWEEGRGRGRTVRLEDVGGAAGSPLLARSTCDGAPDHGSAGERGGGAGQEGLGSSGSFFGPVLVPAGSWKRKRSDRDGGPSGPNTHHSAGSGKVGGAGGETREAGEGVRDSSRDSREGGQRVREKGKTKGQRNKGQRMASLPKIAGTPPTPLQAEAPTPDTNPPASPSPWLSEPGDDLFGPPSNAPPGVPAGPMRRARNAHPGKSSKHRTQQLHALGMGAGAGGGLGHDGHQAPSVLVDASPLPWTPRDSGTPDAYPLVDLPTEPLEGTLGGMGMGIGMQSLEEPTPVDMGMPDAFGTPGLGVGGGEAQGFGEGAAGLGDGSGVPAEGEEAGGLPEPPMPDGEGDMGWLSNLNMDNLGDGLDSLQGLAVPMDDLSELGF